MTTIKLEDALEELKDLLHDMLENEEDITGENETRVLELLGVHPILLLLHIENERRQTPLHILVVRGASLTTIQSVCAIETETIQETDYYWQYPLHAACASNKTCPGVIPFLTQSFPCAAREEDMSDHIPIQCLFQRRSHGQCTVTLEDVRALVEESPKSSVADQERLLRSSLMIQRNGSPEILKFIVSQCPSINSFRADSFKDFSLSRSIVLATLLPQLKDFRFRSRHVDEDGWSYLMQALSTNQSLHRLHIDLERTTGHNGVTSADLNRALASISNLRDLTLLGSCNTSVNQDGQFECHDSKTGNSTITRALVSLLERNTLESIRLERATIQYEIFFETLKHTNTSLRRMNVVECVDSEIKRKALAKRLMEYNTSLQDVRLRSYSGGTDAAVYDQIEYLTNLNRFGRCQARNPRTRLTSFVNLLHDANVRSVVSRSRGQDYTAKLDSIHMLFGLLRECPSIWSGTSG